MTVTTTDTITISAAEAEWIDTRMEQLEEALGDAARMLAAQDYGWSAMGSNGNAEVTISREVVRSMSRMARLMTVADPLIRRGVSLHVAYVWGAGVTIAAKQQDGDAQDVDAVVQSFLDDPLNQKSFTSRQAHEELERLFQWDGEHFYALVTNPRTGRVQVRRIPVSEIADEEIITNPEDAAEVWFYQRSYTTRKLERGANGFLETREVSVTEYHPDINYRPTTRDRYVNGRKVRWDAPVLHSSVNTQNGRGVPDLSAALSWAKGYKEYLEDWAKYMKAISRFAFKATARSRSNGTQIREAITTRAAAADGAVGETVVTGEGQKFEAIGKSGATIDAGSGRPLAAMVAAALNVPVTMLLADPGVTGARATAETLDRPLHEVIKARRGVHTDTLLAVLNHVVREAVRAPAGPLRGQVVRDPYSDRETVVLAGDQPIEFQISFPQLDEIDTKTLMEALKLADDMDKLPDLLLVQLIMTALDVQDPDEWLEKVTDADGNFVPPSGADAAQAQLDAIRDGNLPR